MITPEHRAKMTAGIKVAAEKRRQAKATAGMSAGHERDEQRRINKDNLEARAEQHDEQHELGAIDPAKLAKRDRETLFRVEDSKDGVQNPQPGYRYIRVTIAEGYRENGSKANIRQMHALAKKYNFEPVHGDMVEDEKYKGNDHATGSSLRGLADTVLYRQSEEAYQAMQADIAEKARRQGAIEQETVRYAESRGVHTMHGAAGDFRSQDPLMASVAGEAGRVETFRGVKPQTAKTNFTEGDLRRGSLRGPSGQIMKPGFETQMGRH
jgi:hypothetical protein